VRDALSSRSCLRGDLKTLKSRDAVEDLGGRSASWL